MSLDGLRGLAALLVVQRHFVLAVKDFHTPLLSGGDRFTVILDRFIRDILVGPTVVPIFFVLSGFVLAFSYMKPNPAPLGSFLIRRIARLWMPFAAVIVTVAVLQSLLVLADDPIATEWVRASWYRKATVGDVARHLFLTGQEFWLDNPTWTLSHELRLSLIFPALVSLTLRNSWMALALSLSLSAFATGCFVYLPAQTLPPSVAASFLSTLQYVFLFVIGIFAATRYRKVSSFVFGLRRRVKLLLWLFALLGIYANPLMDKSLTEYRLLLRLIVGGFASSLLLILCATEGRGMRLLRSSIPMYLSKISFSLYLLHVVLIQIIFRSRALLGYKVGLKLLFALILSLFLAHVMQRWIEAPCTVFGRKLAQRFAGKVTRPTIQSTS